MKPVALQLYSLRDALAKDFEGIVRSVAAMGYVGVEPYGGMPAGLREAADLFEELELEVCSSHVPFPDRAKLESALAEAEAFDLSRLVVAFLPQAEFETLDAVKRVCERLNRASKTMQASKVQLGYHNHWWEYQEVEGRIATDILLEYLAPEVFFQVDVYWVQVGGPDPAGVLERLGARAPLLHLKDGPCLRNTDMTALGEGKVDLPGVIAAGGDHTEWHIVELDSCATDMVEAVRKSYNYLVGNGLSRGNA